MKIDLEFGELCLRQGEPIRLTRASGLRIRCTFGMVWITVTGEPADIILSPGQSWRINSQGLALIESIDTGRVHLEMTRPTGKLDQRLIWIARAVIAFESWVRPARLSRKGRAASAPGFPV